MGYDLTELASETMIEKGLSPQFPQDALDQLNLIKGPASKPSDSEDLSSLLWCSIDNDDSLDLDQLTFAKKEEDGRTALWIAIADVDALVPKNSPIDLHAQINTTSVYTPSKIFPMLPEKLSTNLTSLNENEDRVAIVVKVKVTPSGDLEDGTISSALVRNYAKLTYNGLGGWLQGQSPMPEKIKTVPGLEEALRCQHEAAQILRKKRHILGALTLEPADVEAKVKGDKDVTLTEPVETFANQLIEHFMIAANFVMATTLKNLKISSLRRVVRVPKRWDRLVEIAASFGEHLPDDPNPLSLEAFLVRRKEQDPVGFPDLSLVVIKLLGRGEYIVETPDDKGAGHFGLALREYTHSTAPNRRYPDLISQRQFKAHLRGEKDPYSFDELKQLANHCTKQEDAATHVERHLTKSAAALLLSTQIGASFKGIITGAGDTGTWIRIFSPPVEGKIIKGEKKLDVGDQVAVKLVNVDIPKGFINFVTTSTKENKK